MVEAPAANGGRGPPPPAIGRDCSPCFESRDAAGVSQLRSGGDAGPAQTVVNEIVAAGGKRPGRKPGKASKAKASGGGRRRKRAKITDAMREEVKKMVEAGKTGSEIAKAVGISLPSVQNIKKQLGLVKAR